MITSSDNVRKSRGTCSGFTLAELMVTLVVFGIVLGSIIPTFIFFTQSIKSLGNYTIMSGESRYAMELVGRDLHSAEDLVKASRTELEVELPADMDAVSINYKYDSAKKTLTRTKYSSSGSKLSDAVLFEDLDVFQFVYYNRRGLDVTKSASILNEAKSVQVNAKLLKKVFTVNTTDYVISARFLMRNND